MFNGLSELPKPLEVLMKKKMKMMSKNKASQTRSFADLVPDKKKGGPKTSPTKDRKNKSGKMKMSALTDRLKNEKF